MALTTAAVVMAAVLAAVVETVTAMATAMAAATSPTIAMMALATMVKVMTSVSCSDGEWQQLQQQWG